MAKLFYSIDEAATRLGKSADDLRAMARRGEITEFRDGDRLIFKKDQIDLLAGGEDEDAQLSGMIPLSDSSAGSSIGISDTPIKPVKLTETAGSTATGPSGISIFDDDTTQDDPSAVTQMAPGALDSESLDSFSGGSAVDLSGDGTGGIAGDSMLGELYSGGSLAGATALGASAPGSLFEGESMSAGAQAARAAAAPGLGLAEAYDGRGSWMTIGLLFGALAAMLAAGAVMGMAFVGLQPDYLRSVLDGNILILTGIAAGLVVILGGLGFALGGKG